MAKFVFLREFLSNHDAGIAKGLLEEAGIKCQVTADDCGGINPALSFVGVRVMVLDGDLEKAREVIRVLDSPDEQESP